MMQHHKHLLVFSLMLLPACSWLPFGGEPEPVPEATLADLQPARMPDTSMPVPSVDIDNLTERYRDVMRSATDAEVKVQVMHRLAGLEMVRGEQKLDEEQATGDVFGLAIDAYQELLAKYPDRPGNDRLLYQLSKAYDLDGQVEQSLGVLNKLVRRYPKSSHIVEAQFRRAEIFFSKADYKGAERSYGAVIKQGKASSHYRNALYMHGWTQFKRGRYRASLKSFTLTLDLLVLGENEVRAEIAALKRGERELTEDTLRVMSLAFSYLDGPKTITQVYRSLGERHYLPLLYDRLGALYLTQERYRDSAEVYRTFVKQYPSADQSPAYYGKLIKAFEAGNFPAEVLVEKEKYVNGYGINSTYWGSKDETVRDQIRPHLKQYLNELARHYHALAQNQKAIKTKSKTKARANLKAANQSFLLAGNYYQAYVDTFPQDKQVAEMLFLLAESRFEAGRYTDAIAAFEKVAYSYPDDKRAANAGYSVILSYNHLLESAKQPIAVNLLPKKISAELRFADVFKQDPRATTVLTKAAQELLGLKDYQQAAETARRLVAWQPSAKADLRRTAWLVVGHSEFELEQFGEAEIAYQQVLQLMGPKDAERKALVERVAASVYKQGEQLLAKEDLLGAAQQFLRVAKVAPKSPIVVNAQYDAATHLLAAKEWAQAISVLEDFRVRFPRSKLKADIPERLVLAYQETGQWQLAAQELTGIYERAQAPKAKREALYLAAELFEKAGDKETAILRYRKYAHTYPEPFTIAMEARYRLSELYRVTKQNWKREFWLKKMILADSQAGKERNDRSRYLAAFSSDVFADASYLKFQQIKIKLPLKRSLKKKKAALKKALAAHQKVLDYEVQEFATKATFRIGAIYANLSSDLMASQRPKNLDALALEQYDVLLEEQAFPFEEKAIDIHETNAKRSWKGIYDDWVKQSFAALGELLPARYGKTEQQLSMSHDIY